MHRVTSEKMDEILDYIKANDKGNDADFQCEDEGSALCLMRKKAK